MRVTKWDTDISQPALTFRAQATVVKREGTVSSFPAVFARLPSEHALLRVRLDAAPLEGNMLTFGLARRGMKTEYSDGLGRTVDSWGMADDRLRSSHAVMPVLAAGGKANVVNRWHRRVRQGDVLTAEVNTVEGWCELRLNDTEALHRFGVPRGTREDYWFGVTLATDHQVSILPEDTQDAVAPADADSSAASSPTPPTPSTVSAADIAPTPSPKQTTRPVPATGRESLHVVSCHV